MQLGEIRDAFGNLPAEFELPFEVDGKPVEWSSISREGIVGTTVEQEEMADDNPEETREDVVVEQTPPFG